MRPMEKEEKRQREKERERERRVTDENIRGDLIPDKSNFTHVGDSDTSGKAEPDERCNPKNI